MKTKKYTSEWIKKEAEKIMKELKSVDVSQILKDGIALEEKLRKLCTMMDAADTMSFKDGYDVWRFAQEFGLDEEELEIIFQEQYEEFRKKDKIN